MTTTAGAAARLRPPRWRDGRVLVGLALILLATAAGVLLTRAADSRTGYYVAQRPLVPGTQLQESDLKSVRLHLGAAGSNYVPSGTKTLNGYWVAAPVAKGQVLPAAALVSSDVVDLRDLAIPVDATAAAGLTRGAIVDLYVSAPLDGGGAAVAKYSKPKRALQSVSVAAVDQPDTMLGSGQSASLHLMVPADEVVSLISAMDAESRFTVVPVPGAPR